MSHELRTPLNAIIGFSEIVHDELMAPLASANKEFVAEILNSSRHLLRLIDEILDLARLEAGRMDFTSEDFDLTEVCQEVIASLYPLLATKHLSTNVDVDPDAQHARMDGHRLRQVLYNSLSNAVKFTPEGGYITVRVHPVEGNLVRIEVEDSGIGIAADQLPKLFHQFQQLDSSMSKKQPGTGLGLALTKQIVEAQGGNLGVKSTPGQGSLFFVELPRYQ
jgi:signal transduction histidine kinase